SYGRQIGDAIIALRANDGWDDYVVDNVVDAPGQWQPTAPSYAAPLDPQWATLQPWVMTSSSQFQPSGPPALTSQEWADAYNEVKDYGAYNSTVRTTDETQIARFWADNAGTSTPPGHWNDLAEQVAMAQGNSTADNARLFAMLDITLADAAIVAFNAKYTYDFWRPITAIQNGDTDGNDLTVADPSWQPFLLTPNFPEYVSGHSTFSGAAATILDSVFGSNYSFTTTSEGLAGVTRTFSSFDAAAAEAGQSRIYAGIHWQFSNADGQAAGRSLADYILTTFDTSSDTVPPRVLVDNDAGQATKTNPTIAGHVLDNLSGVQSLTASVDGAAALAVSYNSFGQYSFTPSLATNGSADGSHTVSFVASDAAGNVSDPVSFTFTLDTVAPTLNISSPLSGGTLSAGDTLTGNVNVAGSPVVQLSYTFSGQPTTPIVFDPATGAFSASLNLAKLAPGATTLTVTTTDAAGNSSTQTLNLNLSTRVPFDISNFTPLDGADDVGATYKPQVFFSRPVNTASLNSNNFYATGPDGTKLAANIVPADDGTFAWLFFTQPMPGSSKITIHLDGSTILAAADGAALDADGNGSAGGLFTFSFSTVSLMPLVGTSLSGKVLDVGPDLKPMTFDDIRVGPDQVMHTADDVYLLPIAGAKVSILGTTEVAFTDASGNFHFDSAPAGDVKLSIDGRTATNSPTGYFFPEMVMDLQLEAGRANTVMGTMGTDDEKAANLTRPEVYLPRLQTSILQNVSNTAPTIIKLQSDAAATLTPEQQSQLSITIAPGSLRDQNG
ncbi:MAG TPA: Ig-like domain-containing protein, partial [Planctomycetaceae bacterium]